MEYMELNYRTDGQFFDSYAALTEEASVVHECEQQRGNVHYKLKEGFLGRRVNSMKHVERLVFEPYEQSYSAYEELKREVDKFDLPEPADRKRKKNWNEYDGNDLCHDRIRAGQSCWRGAHRQHTKGPTQFTIAVNVATSCMVPPRDIIWKVAAACAMTELLEAKGYRVQVVGVATTKQVQVHSSSSRDVLIAVPIKHAGSYLDLQTTLNVMSGWCFRSTWFAHLSNTYGRTDAKVSGCLGIPAEVPSHMLEDLMCGMMKGTMISVVESDVVSADKARTWMTKFVDQINMLASVDE